MDRYEVKCHVLGFFSYSRSLQHSKSSRQKISDSDYPSKWLSKRQNRSDNALHVITGFCLQVFDVSNRTASMAGGYIFGASSFVYNLWTSCHFHVQACCDVGPVFPLLGPNPNVY